MISGHRHRPRRSRAFNRLTVRRFPSFNPYGDALFAKLKFVFPIDITIPTTASAVFAAFNMNDLSSGAGAFQTVYGPQQTPGFGSYATQFRRYRVNGIKMKATVVDFSTVTEPLLHGFIARDSNNTLSAIEGLTAFVQERWNNYRMLTPSTGNRALVKHSQYWSVNKIEGGDLTVKGDENYTGLVTSGNYQQPAILPQISTLVSTLDGKPPTAAQPVTILYDITFYTKFWNRIQLSN